MPPPNLLPILLLLLLVATSTTAIGVNYGANADNLPSPSAVANFLRSQTTITAVKLFDSNPTFISAFANSQIPLTITLPNSLILDFSDRHSGLPAALQWINSNLLPFLPATTISIVAVGNEILATSDKNLIARLVPAMSNFHLALVQSNLSHIRVTTPHSLGILSGNDFPSSAHFRPGYDKAVFVPMLDFHRKTKSPFMVNPYPYFGYNAEKLNYALFRPNKGVFDEVTKINYTNMFVAQMDAVYTAMKKVGYGDVEIAIGETGWPTAGDSWQLGVSVEDARGYNLNLIKVVEGGKGTPLMPRRKFETFIFELFDENLKWGATAEKHWGLFKTDMTPWYDVGLLRGGGQSGGGSSGGSTTSKKWCIAKANSDPTALQNNINYACSVAGVDCKPINPGGACYNPNTVYAHASYAMNAYYQFAGRHDYNCDFKSTGVITATNPSNTQCTYPA